MFGGGALGVMMVMPLGGLIKNPWAKGDDSPLWVSGWTPNYPGETIYLRRDTGRPEDIVLVRRKISMPVRWKRSSRSASPTVATSTLCSQHCAAFVTR